MARKSERTITLALSALSSPVDRAAPSERAARWVWDAVSQGSANRKEGHCERKYNREMESRVKRGLIGRQPGGREKREYALTGN